MVFIHTSCTENGTVEADAQCCGGDLESGLAGNTYRGAVGGEFGNDVQPS
jgi:hypothetical protein